jgi:predicted TIM-barrel fold metal-dependent hydrolase
MAVMTWKRRTVLTGIVAAPMVLRAGLAGAQIEVPWSSGTGKAKTAAPEGAADCHHHIYDQRFPVDPRSSLRPGDATVSDYRKLQQRIGTHRHVVIQPSTYGTDNRCLLEALAAFGSEARGIAVVDASVSDSELRRLHEGGVRGVRFNLGQPGAPAVEDIKPLAERMHELGWHVQINVLAEQLVDLEDLLLHLPTPVVFDHLGRLPPSGALDHPAFQVISKLLKDHRGWLKLCGAYIDSRVGPPGYDDTSAVARAFVQVAPERLVWGSDWPHPSAKVKPDDAQLFDLLAAWAPDAAVRKRILVDNPVELYGF